jgi:tetratricopeptide (TPR) repeat protein
MEGRLRWLRLAPADCWPGAVRLWDGGWPHGLLLAAVFSILLNATLIVSWLWPALVPEHIKLVFWGITAVFWTVGWIDSRRIRLLIDLTRRQDPQLDLFLSARGEYLKRNWTAAEQILTRLLAANPDDVEARLMLATLLRHGRRWDEAKEQLRRLQRWNRAASWNLEIRREWEQLARLECSAEFAESEVPEPADTGVAGHERREAA